MIIVTGTKRSGTSMWMQILIAAGFPMFGEAFPREWEETIKDANPDGFYESILRRGIYWQTNPHPRTGDYFFPEQVVEHVVKVFIPGLVRTDRAYIGHVVATMRHWAEYEASLNRLYTMETAARKEKGMQAVGAPHFEPVLEWWYENFALVRDIVTRRYRIHVQSYDGLLRDHEAVIRETIGWLGRGDADKAIQAVHPHNRTQVRPTSTSIEPEIAQVFEDLFGAIDERKALTGAFVAKLNETNKVLAPRIGAEHRRIGEAWRKLRQGNKPGPGGAEGPPHDPDMQPSW
jgi:hypothetical protein